MRAKLSHRDSQLAAKVAVVTRAYTEISERDVLLRQVKMIRCRSERNAIHFFFFFKDRGGNLITYFQLSLISTPGLMQYLQSHREHCLTGARPEIIYTPVVCLRP